MSSNFFFVKHVRSLIPKYCFSEDAFKIFVIKHSLCIKKRDNVKITFLIAVLQVVPYEINQFEEHSRVQSECNSLTD